MDYFALLGLPHAFTLDPQALEAAYFAAQRQYHPDRFVGKPDKERQAAMQRSVDINNAYDTLKSPLKRAQYLLKLQGIAVSGEDDALKPTADLLAEVMEWREQAAEAETSEQLDKLDHALYRMAEAAEDDIAEAGLQKDWQGMAKLVLRLGYLLKTREEITTHRIRLKKRGIA